jgi:hypothetical protein
MGKDQSLPGGIEQGEMVARFFLRIFRLSLMSMPAQKALTFSPHGPK